jgi:hypothetical protein
MLCPHPTSGYLHMTCTYVGAAKRTKIKVQRIGIRENNRAAAGVKRQKRSDCDSGSPLVRGLFSYGFTCNALLKDKGFKAVLAEEKQTKVRL